MTTKTDNNNSEGGNPMISTWEKLQRVLGKMDRPLNLEKVVAGHASLVIDDIREPENEQGAFLTAAGLTKTVRMAIDKNYISALYYNSKVGRESDIHLFANPDTKGDVTGDRAGLIHPTTLDTIPGQKVSACKYDDYGRLEKQWAFNTDEWKVALVWVNGESTIEFLLVLADELALFHQNIKVGPGNDEPGKTGREYNMDDAKSMTFEIASGDLFGFGTAEMLLRAILAATQLHPAQIQFISGMFNTAYQITSECLIDNAVQFMSKDIGKANKRANTLDRTAMVNNIVKINNDADRMVFYMFGAGVIPEEIFAGIDKKRMRYMEEKFFDGCILVSKKAMVRFEQMLVARYQREELSDIKGALHKIGKPMTHQVRISGGGLVDQFGNKIGMLGHIKAHVMVAAGVVNERMEKLGLDFVGTTDGFKYDLAVRVEDVLSVVLQPKPAKVDIYWSAQHFTAANLMDQSVEDFGRPRGRHFNAKIKEILELADDEELVAEKIAKLVEKEEEDPNIGKIRQGNNELLATFAASGMAAHESAAAMSAIQMNELSKFGFATLSKDKNLDMTRAGFGRNIRTPASGLYLQVFPEAFVVAAGYTVPTIKQGQLYVYSYHGEIAIGIVSNKDWETFLAVTGDGDLDDFWEVYFSFRNGKREALVMRFPAVWGEYMMFDLVGGSAFIEEFDHQKAEGWVPTIDPSMLPQRVDQVILPNGQHVQTIDVEEAFTTVFGGNAATYTRKDALEVARTYIQQIVIGGVRIMTDRLKEQIPSRIETSYFLGRSGHLFKQDENGKDILVVPSKQNFLFGFEDEMGIKHRFSGPVRGSISSVLRGVDMRGAYPLLESQLVNPLSIPTNVPPFINDYATYVLTTMLDVIKFSVDLDYKNVGGVTKARRGMEKRLEKALLDIKNTTYVNHGIQTEINHTHHYQYKRVGNPNAQAKLHSLKSVNTKKLFGSRQGWKDLRTTADFLELRLNTSVIPTNLDDTQLGYLVRNSEISRFLPAASMVRYRYSKRYAIRERLWEIVKAKDMTGTLPTRKPHDVINRVAWRDALSILEPKENQEPEAFWVDVDINTEEDVYQFILALLYVLRATPQAGPDNLDRDLRVAYGEPKNAFTERILYGSPFMRWTEDGRNVLQEAFEYYKNNRAALLSTPAMAVEPVLLSDGDNFTVFIEKVGDDYRMRRNHS